MTKPDQHAISSILGSEIVGNVQPAHGQMASVSNMQRYMEGKRVQREPTIDERIAEINKIPDLLAEIKKINDLLAEVERLKAELHALKHPPVLTKPDGPGIWCVTFEDGRRWIEHVFADEKREYRSGLRWQRVTLPTPPIETEAGKDGG